MKDSGQRKIVLASASPRRVELLRRLGLEFEVDPADIDEDALHTGHPREDAPRAAYAKALRVAARHRDSLVIGADTMVAVGGRVLGKPAGPDQAREFLRALSGCAHSVFTGLAVIEASTGASRTGVVETIVKFRAIPAGELEAYLQTPDPYDKAGAYGIQSGGGQFIESIEGDYYNVVGLPLARLVELLSAFMDTSSLAVSPPPRLF